MFEFKKNYNDWFSTIAPNVSGPKPDWNLASKLFLSNKYLYVWLKIALSKRLAITERTEMGL